MPRVYKPDRPVRLEVHIPQSLRQKLDAALYSEIEGRVPFGKLSTLVQEQLERWLNERKVET